MLIKCTHLNAKDLFLILFPLFKIIEKIIEKKIILNNFFISPFIISIAQILCIFLWLFRIKLNKRKNLQPEIENIGLLNESLSESIIIEKENENKNDSKKNKKRGLSQFEIYIDENKKKNKIKIFKEIIYFLVLGFIFFIASLLRSLFSIYINNSIINSLIPIFFSLILRFFLMSLLGRSILNDANKFYRHKIMSFALIFIISTSYFFSYLNYKAENLGKILLFLFLSETLYSIFYIGGKKYIQFTYKSPFKLVFFVGVLCFFLLFISQIIFIKYKEKSLLKDYFNNYIKNEDKNYDYDYYFNVLSFLKEFNSSRFLLIPIILLMFINNYFEWQILSFFSSSHFASSNFLYIIILPLFNLEDSIKNIYIFYSLYALIIFLFLIFNEYIILYFCSLEENTLYQKKIKEMNHYSEHIGRTSNSSDINYDEPNSNNVNNNNEQNDLALIENN